MKFEHTEKKKYGIKMTIFGSVHRTNHRTAANHPRSSSVRRVRLTNQSNLKGGLLSIDEVVEEATKTTTTTTTAAE